MTPAASAALQRLTRIPDLTCVEPSGRRVLDSPTSRLRRDAKHTQSAGRTPRRQHGGDSTRKTHTVSLRLSIHSRLLPFRSFPHADQQAAGGVVRALPAFPNFAPRLWLLFPHNLARWPLLAILVAPSVAIALAAGYPWIAAFGAGMIAGIALNDESSLPAPPTLAGDRSRPRLEQNRSIAGRKNESPAPAEIHDRPGIR